MKRNYILKLDGFLHLLTGAALIWSPLAFYKALGMPPGGERLFPALLGAVLFGMGFAFLKESYRKPGRMRGMGLGGAIFTKLCAAAALVALLLTGRLAVSHSGAVLLWCFIAALALLTWLELFSHWHREAGDTSI
ncbi:MAG: hypothetical protein P8Z49_06480 [Acidobacteriota bacterium]